MHESFPGLFFRPSDEVLVDYFLHRRIVDGLSVPDYLIKDFDVYSTESWNLPCDSFRYLNNDKDMHFFTPRRPTSYKSKRADHTAGIGFWDENGKGQLIKVGSDIIGRKTSLNFKVNEGGEKIKIDWIMHEFHLSRSSSCPAFDDLVLCHIHEKKNKNMNDNGNKRSREHEEVGQSLLKRRCIEEEELASLPSSASCHMVSILELLEGCKAPLTADDLRFLEEAPLAPDDGLFLEDDIDHDNVLLSWEDFVSSFSSNDEL